MATGLALQLSLAIGLVLQLLVMVQVLQLSLATGLVPQLLASRLAHQNIRSSFDTSSCR
jgi:hypothetical protein